MGLLLPVDVTQQHDCNRQSMDLYVYLVLNPLPWCPNRSLGLVLLECVLGRYPYNTSGGPMDLMLHIMQVREGDQGGRMQFKISSL